MNSLTKQQIVYFDTECILCNRFVQYILIKDKNKHIFFSDYKRIPNHLIHKQNKESNSIARIHYLRRTKWHEKSTAVLFIFRDIHGKWHYTQLGWLVPKFFRDFIYTFIAKRRYRWFGKTEQCYININQFAERIVE